MGPKFLCEKKLWRVLCLTAGALVLLIACRSVSDSEGQAFAKNTQAAAQLQQINAELNTGHHISTANFETLKSLYSRYATVLQVAEAYKNALGYREDWDELSRMLQAIPARERSRDDGILLANVLIKLGRFAEGLEVLKGLGSGTSDDAEIRSLSALAHFNLGQLAESAAELDTSWDTIIASKRTDDINLRGLIYFRQKDYPHAIECLKTSIGFMPVNPVATNALSRVYAATGDTASAELYRKETEKAQDENTAAEARKLQSVSLGRKLEAAWNAKDYQTVISVAKEMLPLAGEQNRASLEKYIETAEAEIKKQSTK